MSKKQNIKVLDDISHIQLRKGMYIDGDDATHLVEEILDNALDEVNKGNANEIKIKIDTNNNIYSISDNGSGIPLDKIEFNGKKVDIPIVLASKSFSGAKFDNSYYTVKIGLHGVGLVVVNALSEYFTIEVVNSGKIYKYIFENSNFKKLETLIKSSEDFSTRITFKPSPKYLKNGYNKKFIIDRLRIASIFNENLKVIFYEDDEFIDVDDDLENFFVRVLCNNSETLTDFIKFDYGLKNTGEKLTLIMSYDLAENDTIIKSSVNLLPVDSGTHINALQNEITNVFMELAKKYNFVFNKNDSLVGLRLYFNIMIINPEFGGQAKNKLKNNKTEFEKLYKKFRKFLYDYLLNSDEYCLVLLNRFQEYRNKLKSKKNIRKLINNTVVRGIRDKDSRLRDCSSSIVEKCELIICEGESAAGSLLQARDPRYHAILPLRGKVLNVYNVNYDKIMKNKEILDIVRTIGVGLKLNENDEIYLDKIKYGKIILAADRDPDGGHIMVLLMAVMMKLVPDVVKEGYLYIAIPPLYALKGKGFYKPFYDINELKEYMNKNKTDKYQLIRYKGLGEMNPDELYNSVLDKNTRNIIQLRFPNNPDELLKYLTDSNKRRELVFGEGLNGIRN